jgi:hypothetical protein
MLLDSFSSPAFGESESGVSSLILRGARGKARAIAHYDTIMKSLRLGIRARGRNYFIIDTDSYLCIRGAQGEEEIQACVCVYP